VGLLRQKQTNKQTNMQSVSSFEPPVTVQQSKPSNIPQDLTACPTCKSVCFISRHPPRHAKYLHFIQSWTHYNFSTQNSITISLNQLILFQLCCFPLAASIQILWAFVDFFHSCYTHSQFKLPSLLSKQLYFTVRDSG